MPNALVLLSKEEISVLFLALRKKLNDGRGDLTEPQITLVSSIWVKLVKAEGDIKEDSLTQEPEPLPVAIPEKLWKGENADLSCTDPECDGTCQKCEDAQMVRIYG